MIWHVYFCLLTHKTHLFYRAFVSRFNCASTHSLSYLVPTVGPQAYSLPWFRLPQLWNNHFGSSYSPSLSQPPTQQLQRWQQQHFGIMWQILLCYYCIRILYLLPIFFSFLIYGLAQPYEYLWSSQSEKWRLEKRELHTALGTALGSTGRPGALLCKFLWFQWPCFQLH